MRYAQGGGLTAKDRARREQVRVDAAAMFAVGASDGEVAQCFRVTAVSAGRWRRTIAGGGVAALASLGAGGEKCRLDQEQIEQLGRELEEGPAAHGWDEDQRWTLARVAELIEEEFGQSYTLRGVAYLLHRNGFTVQVPTRRAIERDEERIAAWRSETWADVKPPRRPRAHGSASKTKPVSP
jgi:transposase